MQSMLKQHMMDMVDTTFMTSIMQMRGMPYKDYLTTRHWQHFRQEALKFFQYKCQLCDTKIKQLDVHHKTYENLGCETFNDVIVLCNDCHKTYHSGSNETGKELAMK